MGNWKSLLPCRNPQENFHFLGDFHLPPSPKSFRENIRNFHLFLHKDKHKLQSDPVKSLWIKETLHIPFRHATSAKHSFWTYKTRCAFFYSRHRITVHFLSIKVGYHGCKKGYDILHISRKFPLCSFQLGSILQQKGGQGRKGKESGEEGTRWREGHGRAYAVCYLKNRRILEKTAGEPRDAFKWNWRKRCLGAFP